MLALILQVGFWMNSSGDAKQVTCPLVYEQEQRIPKGCIAMQQGILYSTSYYIDMKMQEAENKAKISALQDKIKVLQAELIQAQNQITQCLIKPQPSTTMPFIYGVLSGALTTGVILWSN